MELESSYSYITLKMTFIKKNNKKEKKLLNLKKNIEYLKKRKKLIKKRLLN